MSFEYRKEAQIFNMRAGHITTDHGVINTPVFMPVGTQASVKALSMEQMRRLGATILLANTYHLYLRPGSELISTLGGLHQFTTWDRPFLTDSGGYQVSSLGLFRNEAESKLTRITEAGVEFRSHLDGSTHFIGPEESIKIQAQLGADIVMAFDEATPQTTEAYAIEAMKRTHQWLIRSITQFKAEQARREAQNQSHQALFGIIQGGDSEVQRRQSARFVCEQAIDGIAVGGATIGQDSRTTEKNISWIRDLLPVDKPLYLMGVGVSPEAAIEAIKSGADMFDCVAPAKLARSGLLFVGEVVIPKNILKAQFFSEEKRGRINLANRKFARDRQIISPGCTCPTCSAGYSRAYLRHLLLAKELTYYQLATSHNLHVMISTVERMRTAIMEAYS